MKATSGSALRARAVTEDPYIKDLTDNLQDIRQCLNANQNNIGSLLEQLKKQNEEALKQREKTNQEIHTINIQLHKKELERESRKIGGHSIDNTPGVQDFKYKFTDILTEGFRVAEAYRLPPAHQNDAKQLYSRQQFLPITAQPYANLTALPGANSSLAPSLQHSKKPARLLALNNAITEGHLVEDNLDLNVDAIELMRQESQDVLDIIKQTDLRLKILD